MSFLDKEQKINFLPTDPYCHPENDGSINSKQTYF